MARAVRRMLEHKAQGVAIMTSQMDATLVQRLSDRKVPTVFLDVGHAGHRSSNLRVDYSSGTTEAVRHLLIGGLRLSAGRRP